MTDIELTALTQLVATQQWEMENDNEQRRSNGYALAYAGAIKWPERDALEAELKRREILKS